VRLAIKASDAGKLRKALGGRRGLDVTLQLDATAAAGPPTSQTTRVSATA
jgi:hypothetical protein